MAFGGLEKKPNGSPMAEINMTPLIDVMLVLLVIFIITAPLFTHAIRLELPKVSSQAVREAPDTITLSIDDAGKLYWNDQPLTLDEMCTRFATEGKRAAPPEIHLRASAATRYDVIAQVMGAAQQAGLDKIGFVTQPKGAPAR
ncbi:biopolymer transport protein ExbD/TolR [Caballeronia arationis]|jgi:biopolymer transport protein ExbD|uniref:Biopolymer transport protein ExbD n=1 Tax=Caballeronia arationis TaxID=1777142 RepID=A0A7Z7I748_9BURK|nr:biopolymer transporter ExbD [Caballeronia arationis]SAK49116.1 biopolymer transport protein ExbD/TolR [Caballeronia arationis]SOE80522.1 biopolymer transport protein ExbD [Caballeronia arationis]